LAQGRRSQAGRALVPSPSLVVFLPEAPTTMLNSVDEALAKVVDVVADDIERSYSFFRKDLDSASIKVAAISDDFQKGIGDFETFVDSGFNVLGEAAEGAAQHLFGKVPPPKAKTRRQVSGAKKEKRVKEKAPLGDAMPAAPAKAAPTEAVPTEAASAVAEATVPFQEVVAEVVTAAAEPPVLVDLLDFSAETATSRAAGPATDLLMFDAGPAELPLAAATPPVITGPDLNLGATLAQSGLGPAVPGSGALDELIGLDLTGGGVQQTSCSTTATVLPETAAVTTTPLRPAPAKASQLPTVAPWNRSQVGAVYMEALAEAATAAPLWPVGAAGGKADAAAAAAAIAHANDDAFAGLKW